jgi:hypothetical protein
MKNLFMFALLALATTGVSYGECVSGSCSVGPVKRVGSTVLNVTKELVTVPVRVTKRVVTLPSRVRYNRQVNTCL